MLSNGSSIFVLGAQFGKVFVGLQPGFGYEGDPMRLLFERGFAPTHAFSAFYRYLREDFGAHAVLHFGTHGALEFMPGKQVGLTANCWPERLIGDLPNFYLYAANNPSEGALAKRRSAATLISYLTPPIAHAGLYKGLIDLKASIQRWRASPPDAGERVALEALIHEQAGALELSAGHLAEASDAVSAIADQVFELEQTLIPNGLHTVGESATAEERLQMLSAIAESRGGAAPSQAALAAIVSGAAPEAAIGLSGLKPNSANLASLAELSEIDQRDRGNHPGAGRRLYSSRARRRSRQNAGDPAHGPQSARLRPVPHSERFRPARRHSPGPDHARPPPARNRRIAGIGGVGALGLGQP
jgi:magnesium chelatase subunit H